MAANISYTSYDYKPVDIVSVIASFDADGHIKPLWVRIGCNAYRITYSWCRSKQFASILEFNCRIADGDFERPLAISYHQAECVWTIDHSF